MIKTEYVQGTSRHPWLCRWWLRSRVIKEDSGAKMKIGDGEWQVLPLCEVYVPWWAWGFELLHRLVFGYPKLSPPQP